jgi:hypothetical protein
LALPLKGSHPISAPKSRTPWDDKARQVWQLGT